MGMGYNGGENLFKVYCMHVWNYYWCMMSQKKSSHRHFVTQIQFYKYFSNVKVKNITHIINLVILLSSTFFFFNFFRELLESSNTKVEHVPRENM
jgi:hypothetical protein